VGGGVSTLARATAAGTALVFGHLSGALLIMPPDPSDDAAEEMKPPALSTFAMEVVARGTAGGLARLLGILAALIMFVALADMSVTSLSGVSLEDSAGFLFLPFAYAMGLDSEGARAGAWLLGTRLVPNEFVAFLTLAQSGGAGLD
jgi:CNT family concentrative nucleoside transporter